METIKKQIRFEAMLPKCRLRYANSYQWDGLQPMILVTKNEERFKIKAKINKQ